MATRNGSAVRCSAANLGPSQQQLFSLISLLCAPRQVAANADTYRLIVDSQLDWALDDIGGRTAWIYLPQSVVVRQVADCLVITAR